MMRSRVVALTLAAAVAGCSAGDDADRITSGQDVADLIGCTGYDNSASEEVFVMEGGLCDLGSERVGVYYFNDRQARDSFVAAGVEFGGNYLIGDNWVVDAPSDVLEQIQEEHGGERP